MRYSHFLRRVRVRSLLFIVLDLFEVCLFCIIRNLFGAIGDWVGNAAEIRVCLTLDLFKEINQKAVLGSCAHTWRWTIYPFHLVLLLNTLF
ncbi:hypothetical protein K7X08_010457 [Anisodus acutangulus]|uniref:Uncharacterized protein n=1 Tax=Anisodus acutangulus TaxID=402998 RepID=A0A9Q1N5N7_9SOLA|nr:hypothetical protein K7X08_010457 [Anisodus acutangulus]